MSVIKESGLETVPEDLADEVFEDNEIPKPTRTGGIQERLDECLINGELDNIGRPCNSEDVEKHVFESTNNQGSIAETSHSRLEVCELSNDEADNQNDVATRPVVVKLPTLSEQEDECVVDQELNNALNKHDHNIRGDDATTNGHSVKRNVEDRQNNKENDYKTSDIQSVEHQHVSRRDVNGENYIQTPLSRVTEKTVDNRDNSISKTENEVGNSSKKRSKSAKKKGGVRKSLLRRNTEPALFPGAHTTSVSRTSSRSSKSSERPLRPNTVCGWSKEELDIFLPRKSYFSVHDNKMTQAGIDVRTEEERKRPEWRKFMRMRTMEELYPPDKVEVEQTKVPSFGINNVDSDDEEDGEFSMENVVTSLSSEAGKDATMTRRKLRQNTRKLLNPEREEYKPLYEYLKYIHENPDDYIQMAKYTTKNTDHKHPDNLVRLGRAFRRRQQGTIRTSIYLHAISGLKPGIAEPVHPTTTNPRGGSALRAERVATRKESTSEHVDPDETEIEKLRTKADKWVKGLTTQQFLRAKDLALKDIGEEDICISKWWLAFKTCHYIRVPPTFGDASI